MPRRQRSTPWIQRFARPSIAGVAAVGAVVTAYLTLTKFTGGSAVCPTEGCDIVLSSPYAIVFGLPLTLFGFLAYTGMAVLAIAPLLVTGPDKRDLRSQLTDWTKPLLLIGGTAMMVFSAYLMYLLAFQIQALCIYCLGSAILSTLLFALALFGQDWSDLLQPLFTAFIAAFVVLIATLGVYANVNNPRAAGGDQLGPPITSTSGAAEVALAQHLADTGATFYGAWWCPHCHDQKQLFGQEASQILPYEECSEADGQTQTQACQVAEVRGYPTWEINGQRYSGARSLTDLAQLSGYQGPTNFQNTL
ncbi:vitamin K epoxide reductase family protein [Pseudanabaena sp. FACHB-2040]|uniref:vitamin K epoxide reductase family protein n=1 Tax=Pseudanabaena sp. FACHB-2040 TaxID=2692859 RepID=UPI0016836B9E|nr:vitamin K epoxide reductase family protein [Pseudanabaena sp. FACHB-2040]MBD2258047.1 vitamin K epoxide reductase family protein [Pseudanabaena sp. FACHB-2040]